LGKAAPPTGHLTPHTGRVIRSVRVVPVYWGSFWTAGAGQPLVGRLDAFFDYILASPYMQMLAEYNLDDGTIGTGQRQGSYPIGTSEPPAQVTDAQLQQALKNWIAAKVLPGPTVDTLYFLYLPQGVTVVGPGGATSCAQMCGYHGAVDWPTVYAVVPYIDCPGCSQGVILDALTRVSSHELTEAVTDPNLHTWFDPSNGNEIADICNLEPPVSLGGFVVQTQWSNARNACALRPITCPTTQAVAIRNASGQNIKLTWCRPYWGGSDVVGNTLENGREALMSYGPICEPAQAELTLHPGQQLAVDGLNRYRHVTQLWLVRGGAVVAGSTVTAPAGQYLVSATISLLSPTSAQSSGQPAPFVP
jgi:hypothetical protein